MKSITFIFSLWLAFNYSAQCTGNEPVIDLGPDTVLCAGQNTTLSAPAGYDYYLWSNGSNSQNITANSPGIYSVSGSIFGINLIQNGDFENGTTAASNNFTTAYTPGTGGAWGLLSTEGQYAITTSPSLAHNNFSSCQDHTTGTGNMMVVNGATAANTNVWSQNVTVLPSENYVFSFWVTSVESNQALAQLQLFINGTPISIVTSPSSTGCQWSQITGVWNSGTSTNASLSIINQATSVGGNDFAIDDISFSNTCTNSDAIVITYEYPTAYAGVDKTFCPGETDSLFATTNSTNNTLIWSTNGIPGNTVLPTTGGYYVVTATSPGGCSFSDSALVTLKPMNWEIADLISTSAACGQNSGAVFADIDTLDMSSPAPFPFTYNWSGPGQNSPNQVNTIDYQNLAPGWYYFDISSNGCHLNDSIEVTQDSAPTAMLSTNPITGYAPLAVNLQNTSTNSTSFDWYFNNVLDHSTSTLDPVDTIFNAPGNYTVSLVSTIGNCTDTFSVTIMVLPPPPGPGFFPIDTTLLIIGEIPNVFTPNGDLSNDTYTFEVSGSKTFSITIFNRWGNVVYFSDKADTFSWDGDEAKDGTYFYKYEATGYQGEKQNGQGFLHLIR